MNVPAATSMLDGHDEVITEPILRAQEPVARTLATAERHDPRSAHGAAWDAAWSRLGEGAFAEAAGWFQRVAERPFDDQGQWLAARERMVRHCLDLAGNSATGLPGGVAAESGPIAFVALPPLSVTSLGGFHVRRAGTVLPTCRTRKAIAIFRYLLTRPGRSAHKDELIDLLWPDSPVREAGHSLHVAISALRRYLDLDLDLDRAGSTTSGQPSYVPFEAGHYRLHPGAVIEEDRLHFLRLSDDGDRHWRARNLPRARAAYGDALASYQGDYQVDAGDPVWAVAERERLLTRYLVALDHLGQIEMAEGCFESAATCYDRLLERDGFREDAHARLMRCYWRLGRRGDAVRQFNRCAAILDTELGLSPTPELQQLFRRIVDSPSAAETSDGRSI